jgi:hypothetical protein
MSEEHGERAMNEELSSSWQNNKIPDVETPGTGGNGGEDRQSAKSETSRLIALMGDCVFMTDASDETPLAIVPMDAHRELHPLKSSRFKGILRRRYFQETSAAPREQAFNDAMRTLEALALSGRPVNTWLRVAEHDGAVWIDLCDERWRAVRITESGWEIVAQAPVHFLRRRGMAPLPEPECGGDFAALWRFLNVSEEYQPLIAGFLVNAFRPTGSLPLLALTGEQGTAKSTAARVLRCLIDPSTVPLRSPPRDEGELLVSARASWIVCFDNLSGLPAWLSDGLCRLATGGGLAKRALYTDTEQVLADIRRPAIINGIEDVASRPDLAERTFAVELAIIPEEQRRAETEFWRDFNAEHPRLLGAIIDALCIALRNREKTAREMTRLPRMADAAIWATAAEPALGFAPGAFMAALRRNQDEAATLAVEHSPAALALRKLMAGHERWEGTPTELLAEMVESTAESDRRAEGWPKSPAALSQKIKRAAPALRRVGIQAQSERTGAKRTRRWIVTREIPAQQ